MIAFRPDGRHIIFHLLGIKISIPNPFINFMNEIYLIDLKGNAKRVYGIKNLKIQFEGIGSKIYVHKPLKFKGKSQIFCKDNCTVTIKGARARIKDFDLRLSSGSTFYLGKNFSCGGTTIYITPKENMKVHIGDDCLFSHDIVLMTSDSHKIYNNDDNSKTAINPDENIIIGNHVWISYGVTVLKGTHIADNSVVGAKALVNKKFEQQNIVIAGTPAKKIKENINWDHNF